MALGLGALFCIILLELTLWLVWLGQSSNQVMPSQLNQVEGKFLIATLGNSYTYGIGASDRVTQSYPAQLKNLLNERAGGDRVEVHNLALGNMTSGEGLRSLKEYLSYYEPSLVTLRVGEPNQWNPSGYLEYLRRNHLKASFWQTLRSKIEKIRLYKLVSHITYQSKKDSDYHSVIQEARIIMGTRTNLMSRNDVTRDDLLPEDEERVIQVLKAYADYKPEEVLPHLTLAMIYYSKNQHEFSLKHLENAQELASEYLYQVDYVTQELMGKVKESEHPDLRKRVVKLKASLDTIRPDAKLYNMMGRVFTLSEIITDENATEYEEIYRYFLKHSPGRVSFANRYILNILLPQKRVKEALEVAMEATLSNPAFSFRIRRLVERIKHEQSLDLESLERRIDRFSIEYKRKYDIDFFLNEYDEVTRWAIDDIDQMIAILTQQNISYVLLNYPPPVKLSRPLDDAIRSHAKFMNYNFIDTRHNLEKFFKMPHVNKKSFYAFDGNDEHPNGSGYALMAEEIANYVWLNFRDQVAKKD